ncbi:MAG: peptide ABC transporter ATP-binding protein, partial [Boseongicola sp.]
MAKLELKGVTKSFGDNVVCAGIDLTVGTGEMVCLIGASGSDKTTHYRSIKNHDPLDQPENQLQAQ